MCFFTRMHKSAYITCCNESVSQIFHCNLNANVIMIIVHTIGMYIKIKINLLEVKRATFICSYFDNYNYSILFMHAFLFYNSPMRNIFVAHEISFGHEQWYVGINCERYRYNRKIFNKPQYCLKKSPAALLTAL